MKKGLLILGLVFYVFLMWTNFSIAQHTFSIVAVDTVTGEVGSAGASFVGGVPHSQLSDIFNVHPGVGAINTQALYDEQNQIFVNQLMDVEVPPQGIIDAVIASDAAGDPSQRQYIAIDLVDGGRTGAYTGVSCPDYANHILGKNYAIAGNILYGQEVLDNMESGFLNTPGSLADKLMAALQGGKEAGGDKRGEQHGLSSLLATMRIAKSGNSKDSLYLDLFVTYDYFGPGLGPERDPVDSLKIIYDEWKADITDVKDYLHKMNANYSLYQNYPNPFNPKTTISYQLPIDSQVELTIYSITGQKIKTLVSEQQQAGYYKFGWDAGVLPSGVYFYQLMAGATDQVGVNCLKTRKIILIK
jgi:uncharacterized Ntn-hydrolase superfamily protein